MTTRTTTPRILHAGLAATLGAAVAILFAACSGTMDPQPPAQPPAGMAAPATPPVVVTAPAPTDAIAAAAAGNASAETVVVTGTRVRRDDYTAADATVVVTAEQMQALGVTSVADMIAQLPANRALSAEEVVAVDTDQVTNFGMEIANLRGLNTADGTRTLTLVDSSRFAPTTGGDAVDLNMIPTALIGRIETVTGGASATYGADAMAGAVNVIIEPQGGEPRRGSPGRQIGGAATQATTGSEAGLRFGRLAQSAEAVAAPVAAEPQADISTLVELVREGRTDDAEEFERRRQAFLDRQRPLSRVVPGEEVWVISQEFADAAQTVADDALGSGVMIARYMPAVVNDLAPPPQVIREVPLPLKHTDVDAKIQGYVGTVDVTQQFENPFSEKIEAVYMFPLPEKAAVSEFVMTIGERRIRGILRDKEEAQQIYQQARAQGYNASLLTQHRPNVFEQKVANIEPGKQIDVNIRYYETLAYADGWYSFVFPTVVGPRYNPPGSSDPLAAVPRTQYGPVQGEAVRYMAPNEASQHDVSIKVELDAGVTIEEINASHPLARTGDSDDIVHVELADGSMLPNKDFRLDFRVAGDEIKSNLLTYVDAETGSGYFTLMLYPPADLERLQRQPLEMVFVLDCSGSMSGAPIEQAKAAIIAALDRLEPGDTFQIIRFSQSASQFGTQPVLATRDNISAARRYVRQLSGSGGTQMIEGIHAALNFPHDQDRLRFVTFLTDGFIGNETDILGAIDANLGASRIFSFGVGSSPNRYLLERMAGMGRGAVAWLSLEDSGADVMDAFFDRVAHPAMIDVDIDWGGMQVAELYPRRMPDLFVGRPVVVTGRFTGRADDVRMRGRAAGRRVSVALNHDGNDPEHAFLPNLWARLKIADLNDRLAAEPQSQGLLSAQIRETALSYRLMSDYTSFVAVDASQQTAGTRGTTVYQAVPVPEGVRYETTVGR